MYTCRSAVREVARREMGLGVGQAAAGDVVLVAVLATMACAAVLRLLLVGVTVVLMTLLLLLLRERLAQVHLHIGPVRATRKDIVRLVRVALVEHCVLWRGLGTRGPRRGGRVCVEGYAAGGGW